MTPAPRLLYCHCAFAQVVPKATKEAVLAGLLAEGVAFEAVPDLCELSAKKDPALSEFADGAPTRVVACYPRAVKWLFHSAGVTLPESTEVVNMRTDAPEAVLLALNIVAPAAPEGSA